MGEVINTARLFTEDLAKRVSDKLATAIQDTKVPATTLASLLGISATRVAAWTINTAHAPLYLIGHEKIPKHFRLRLISDAFELAAILDEGQSIETATGLLVGIVGDCLAALGRAMADGRIDEHERDELRPLVAAVRDRCTRWLQAHGAEASK